MEISEAIDLLDNLIGMVDDNHHSDYDGALHLAIEALSEPQIIRCKECKHLYISRVQKNTLCMVCYYHWVKVDLDDFCSLAERKEND